MLAGKAAKGRFDDSVGLVNMGASLHPDETEHLTYAVGRGSSSRGGRIAGALRDFGALVDVIVLDEALVFVMR
jgi:hypothetical protein